LVKVRGSDRARVGAGLVALVVDKVQQLADFMKRKAEFARPENEANTPLVRRIVPPIAALRTRRFGQKTDLLVITHGLQIAARPKGELSSLHALHIGLIAHRKNLVDPVVATDRMLRHA